MTRATRAWRDGGLRRGNARTRPDGSSGSGPFAIKHLIAGYSHGLDKHDRAWFLGICHGTAARTTGGGAMQVVYASDEQTAVVTVVTGSVRDAAAKQNARGPPG
ncbi:MAG: hypothetical protein JWR58_4713 [Pseudonocardia sp.]|nr:hypothetical protein [Pseudonocardia sp.]